MKIFIIDEKDISGLTTDQQQKIRHCLQAIKDRREKGEKKIAFELIEALKEIKNRLAAE